MSLEDALLDLIGRDSDVLTARALYLAYLRRGDANGAECYRIQMEEAKTELELSVGRLVDGYKSQQRVERIAKVMP